MCGGEWYNAARVIIHINYPRTQAVSRRKVARFFVFVFLMNGLVLPRVTEGWDS